MGQGAPRWFWEGGQDWVVEYFTGFPESKRYSMSFREMAGLWSLRDFDYCSKQMWTRMGVESSVLSFIH